jgi:ankyrin repeat protein
MKNKLKTVDALFLSSDKDNCTPLHIAAEAGSISNVKLLVFDDEDLLRAEDDQGRTALHIACMNGYRNIVSFLLENGADPLVRMEGGMNCLEVAVVNKKDDIVEELLLSDHWKNVSRMYSFLIIIIITITITTIIITTIITNNYHDHHHHHHHHPEKPKLRNFWLNS